jgi:hypothetical protein
MVKKGQYSNLKKKLINKRLVKGSLTFLKAVDEFRKFSLDVLGNS